MFLQNSKKHYYQSFLNFDLDGKPFLRKLLLEEETCVWVSVADG